MSSYQQINDFELRIKDEIARYQKEIELRNIKIETLRDLLASPERKTLTIVQRVVPPASSSKPEGFILTEAMMTAFKRHVGVFAPSDVIFQEIIRDYEGFVPNRKSFNITLGVWVKNQKLLKDGSKDGYMLAI